MGSTGMCVRFVPDRASHILTQKQVVTLKLEVEIGMGQNRICHHLGTTVTSGSGENTWVGGGSRYEMNLENHVMNGHSFKSKRHLDKEVLNVKENIKHGITRPLCPEDAFAEQGLSCHMLCENQQKHQLDYKGFNCYLSGEVNSKHIDRGSYCVTYNTGTHRRDNKTTTVQHRHHLDVHNDSHRAGKCIVDRKRNTHSSGQSNTSYIDHNSALTAYTNRTNEYVWYLYNNILEDGFRFEDKKLYYEYHVDFIHCLEYVPQYQVVYVHNSDQYNSGFCYCQYMEHDVVYLMKCGHKNFGPICVEFSGKFFVKFELPLKK